MALVAGLYHFVPFFLPGFLSEPGDICCFYDIESCCRIAVWIEDSESLEEREVTPHGPD